MKPEPAPTGVILPFSTSEARERNMDSKNAFGRAISLDYWSVDPTIIEEVTPEDIGLVQPMALQTGLFTNQGFSVAGVSLMPEEYEAIVRSPRALAKAVMAKTLRARTAEPDLDARLSAAQRSVQHAFEGKQTTLQQMRLGLANEEMILRVLLREAEAPGYAHYRESRMRMFMTFAWTSSFSRIIEVNAFAQAWDDAVYNRARLALVKDLLTGPQNQKVGKWKAMLRLGDRYNRAKQGLTRDRIAKISRY